MTLPPIIMQSFDQKLLSRPVFKFGDNQETFWDMYRAFCYKYFPKVHYCKKRHEKAMQGIKEFLAIYERIKKKEKELAGTPGDIAKRPVDYVILPDRRCQALLTQLRIARLYIPQHWNDLPFQEV